VVRGGMVRFESARYPGAGQDLPNFAPFVETAIGIPFSAEDRNEPHEIRVPSGPDVTALQERLTLVLGAAAVSIEPLIRLRHGHGHHLEEIFHLLYGQLERVPDVVVWPATDEEVALVLTVAREFEAVVIPFGGGTCVSLALTCPCPARLVISLDLGRMNQVRWIDPVTRTACIEGGAVGRHIERCLAEHGFTLGHEPDSVEFSTLGGWIATNASGMKKNRYGNIEEVVLDVTVVSSAGTVEHSVTVPRASHGVDVRRLAFGSEGMFGVITRAVVKIHRLPEVTRYGSLVFPDFARGLAFLTEMSEWQALPASVRLVDNLQFRFGQACKPPQSGLTRSLQKAYLARVRGIDLTQMAAATLVYEGSAREQRELEGRVLALAGRYGGVSGGPAAGQAGYGLTFGIAYIRDFLLPYWTIGDSFETAVPWGKVDAVVAAVQTAVRAGHAELGLSGHPFVTARVSQIYQTGACVYFYLGFYYKGVSDPVAAFRSLEHVARQAILDAGGALSHHHGIGKIRAGYLPQIKSEAALCWVQRVKGALDPEEIFSAGNQVPPLQPG
jgi:alkyldihydroxyacetonephosphate synthase